MRISRVKAAVLLAACCAPISHDLHADDPMEPSLELQSGALTPGLSLPESGRPIHQVRLLADVGKPGVSRGTLLLDPNAPMFDEFGDLVGGVVTYQSRGERGSLPTVKLECSIDSVKAGRGAREWHLYRLRGPEIKTPLLLATLGPVTSAGPARLLVLGKGKKVESVVSLTRYGLIPP